MQDQTNEQENQYEPTDIFLWANNLVQFVDDLKISLYFFNKNYTVYRAKLGADVSRQLRPLFLDDILEFILGGIEQGLKIRDFEEAEAEENVLQRTRASNVDKLTDTLRWIKSQQSAIETFVEEEHDLKRIKGVIAHCSHDDIGSFYLIKTLPSSQIMKGHTAWLLESGVFKPFVKQTALKIPQENQLLLINDDLFVFNQAKLKNLFGYDAKATSIALQKVAEIEAHFSLSYLEGVTMQSLVKGKPATIKKLQKIDVTAVKQSQLVDHAEEIGIDLMTDENGRILIMDDKDLTKFVNLLNDDYIESALTGQRYEIIKKRPIKINTEDKTEVL